MKLIELWSEYHVTRVYIDGHANITIQILIFQAGQAHNEPGPVTYQESMAPKRKAANAKPDPWSLDELLTSQESKLIDVDLHVSPNSPSCSP